ncbi:MAG: porin family protein [Paludibacter sp.]|nr:porin family protein [Paludibacter sp.]
MRRLLKRLNLILVGTCILYSINSASAQINKFKSETYLGISGGPAASMVYFKPTVEQDYLTAYHGGLVFRYISEKHLGIQAELNYSQRGWKEIGGSFEKRLDYLEIPFLTHIYFGDKAQFIFNIGPKIGYLIQEKILYNSNPSSTVEQHIQPIQNKFDYGFAAGLGFLFKIKRQVFQLESRANMSFSDIFSNDRRDYFDNSNLINASVTLGWLIQVR